MGIFSRTDILLPQGVPLERWSVIACDQFTSEPAYWREAETIVGDAPSALRLILPEAWLGTERAGGAAERISAAMEDYLARGVFTALPDSLIYVERTQPDGRVRRGLVGAVDLEAYDFAPGSRAPIRATEDTVADRLPPRVRVRAAARLELPHAMVLMDDRDDRVLGPLSAGKHRLRKVYDFDLMLGGGHIAGWQVRGPAADTAEAAVASLGDPAVQEEKYRLAGEPPLVLAMGDGNHSLAAARLWWEELKKTLTPAERENHPARYSLVELVSLHEPAVGFEPIHRLLLDTETESFAAESAAFWRGCAGDAPARRVRCLAGETETTFSPAVATLGELIGLCESFCREYIRRHGGRIDYIHGDGEAETLARGPGRAAVLLPPMDKNELFSSVLQSGAFPRKSFSIGHARDKRYYLECRALR